MRKTTAAQHPFARKTCAREKSACHSRNECLHGQANLQTHLACVSALPRLAAQRTARQAILVSFLNFRIFGNSGFFAQARHTVPEPAPPHHSGNVFKTEIMSQPCAKRPKKAQNTRFLRKMLHFVLSAVTPTRFSLYSWEQAGLA